MILDIIFFYMWLIFSSLQQVFVHYEVYLLLKGFNGDLELDLIKLITNNFQKISLEKFAVKIYLFTAKPVSSLSMSMFHLTSVMFEIYFFSFAGLENTKLVEELDFGVDVCFVPCVIRVIEKLVASSAISVHIGINVS